MPDATRRIVRWLIALSCHYSGIDRLFRWRRGPALAILMLHRVRDDDDPLPLSVRTATYRRLVQWLRRRGRLVKLDEGLRLLESGPRATHYVLTFDDGYRDNLALLDTPGGTPPAIVYLATGHIGGEVIWPYRLADAFERRRRDTLDLDAFGIGRWQLDSDARAGCCLKELNGTLKRRPAPQLERLVDEIVRQLDPQPTPHTTPQMLDWNEVVEMARAGVEIGSHTVHHAILSRVDEAVAGEEVRQSHAQIFARTGIAPRHFAYPNGSDDDFGERDARLVREAGFATATTTCEGVNRPGADPYRLLRHNIHESRFLSPFGTLSRALFYSETSGVLDWLRTRRNRRCCRS